MQPEVSCTTMSRRQLRSWKEAPFFRSELFPDAAAMLLVWQPDVTAEVATYTNSAVQKYSMITACATVHCAEAMLTDVTRLQRIAESCHK